MIRVSHDRWLAHELRRAFMIFGWLVGWGLLMASLLSAVVWGWIEPELTRMGRARATAGAAYAAMLDEDTALREYLTTSDTRFLDTYEKASAARVRANAELASIAGSTPTIASGMIATRIAEETWHQRWAGSVAASALSGELSALDGQQLFNAYRREQATLASAIDERTDALRVGDGRATGTRLTMLLAALLAVLVFATRQYRALQAAVVAPLAALLRDIGRVRDGHLTEAIDHEGPHELHELGLGLNDMVRALTAARAMAESRDVLVREHSGRLRQILDASREFSESLNLEYVVSAVRTSTRHVGGYDRVIVWLMDVDQKQLRDADQGHDDPRAQDAVAVSHGLAGRAAKSGRIAFESPDGRTRFGESHSGPVCAIAIPFIVGARVVGVLEARHDEPKIATSESFEVLEMLATHAATAIESARLHALTDERSKMDALTKLSNRHRLDEDLDTECKRSVRYKRPLTLVMLDVDNFKAFNDSKGHPRADVALQEFAEVISGAVRATDTAYRYGGEEFCVLLRETGAADAMIFAERVRERIERRFSSGGLAGITASFGVAELLGDAPTPRALIEAADAAMYESKHAGRNCVRLSLVPAFAVAIQPDVVPN